MTIPKERALFQKGVQEIYNGSPAKAAIFFNNAALMDDHYALAREFAAFASALSRAEMVAEKMSRHYLEIAGGDRADVGKVLAKVAPEAGVLPGSWEALFGAALFYSRLAAVKNCGMDYDLTAGRCLDDAKKASKAREESRLMASEEFYLEGRIGKRL